MIRKLAAAGLVLLLTWSPAFAQTGGSVIIRKPDNSGAVDPANTANQAIGNASLSSIDGKVATAAKQDTGNTSLGSIDTKLTSQATAANQASQITQETALNTVLGLQADAAWSGSGNGTAIALQKYLAAKAEATRALLAGTLAVQFANPQAVTQSGTWNVGNIAGTVTLPTGASTAANQSTEITSLGTIATNTTGAATAANQATGNTSLGSIDTKLTSQATGANQASQLTQETALNTVLGLQADAAWSGSGSGTLQAIQKYIAAKLEASRALLAGTLTVQFASPQAVTQSGTWNVTNISGTVSLPTGAATSAAQTTAQASLTSIDGKTPALGQAAKAASQPVTIASDQYQATSTPAAITITTALTFQSVLASSATRKGCLIQNKSADVEVVFIGANASATVATSLDLQPGQTFSCSAFGLQVTDNISMTSKTLNGATAVVVSQ